MLAPFFHELVSKTLARLHNSTAKEGYLDLLLALFRAISVCSFVQSRVRIYKTFTALSCKFSPYTQRRICTI